MHKCKSPLYWCTLLYYYILFFVDSLGICITIFKFVKIFWSQIPYQALVNIRASDSITVIATVAFAVVTTNFFGSISTVNN